MQLTVGFKRILFNTGYLTFEKVFNLILVFFVGIYVAKYLGPSDYGLYQYAQSFVALFAAFATLGTTNVVIRDLVSKPEKKNEILGTTFILMSIGGGIAFLIVFSISMFLTVDSKLLVTIAAVTLVLQSFKIFDYWFQSQVLVKYSVFARTTAQISIAILKVILIFRHATILYFVLSLILIWLIQGCIWIYYFHKLGYTIKDWTFNGVYAKKILKASWPLMVSSFSVAIYMKIDLVMIKSMLDSTSVGHYSIAVKISELWYFIPISVTSSLFPSIILSKKSSLEKYYKRLQYLYDIMAGLALMIAIPMTFLSHFIIDFLYGIEYLPAAPVLAIHIWAGIFVFLGASRSKWLINENHQIYAMIFTMTGAIINIILNYLLLPKMGILGAAWATVISYLLSAWLLTIIFSSTRISFYMMGKAILKSLLIFPLLISLLSILKEAKAVEK